ncbi:Hypothetical predicted protein [Olea europaea subsp. europaea]|uniref:Neprosin PEP catalytic domain-containing protein n=1 Tax=Olea europaea subsp. europaea TaxID=158383 RepID=A0A8S0QT06_OLEEU|nr:Hypothetical predicted protein [Olea europaea subsp. europaea]
MGTRISPVSSYRNSQYDIAFFCGSLQWLCIGLLAIFLILLLSRQCFHDRCGGEVINSQLDRQSTLTQMGSGRLPEEGFGKSGYFKNIQVVDSSKNLEASKEPYTEQSNCYDMQTCSNGDWGHYFYYGGHGAHRAWNFWWCHFGK